ncbi:MAG: hypothetical protein IJH47_01415 [Oscillospiraceae bacterium]|nr:hypothetical protein [Oscillospiraceae bacterium]
MDEEKKELGTESPTPEDTSKTEPVPAEEKPAGEAPAEEKPAGEAPTEEKPAGEASAEEASAEENPEKKRKLPLRPVLLIALAAIAAAVVWFLSSHVIVGNSAIPKNAAATDLRGQSVTVEEFNELSAKLPDTEIRWNVPLSTGDQDSFSEELTLSALTEEDVERMQYFPRLKRVSFTDDFTDFALAQALAKAFPKVEADWSVELGGKRWPHDTKELTLDVASVTAKDLKEKLKWLPAAESVTFTGGPAGFDLMDALAEAAPGAQVTADLDFLGKVVPSDIRDLSYAGRTDLTAEDLAVLRDNVRRLPELESLDLTDCGLEDDALVELASDLDLDVLWSTHVYGVPVHSTDTEIDLSYRKLGDNGAQVEALVPGMHHLEKVVMLECGISDEDMDALNKRHEDVKFVWMVHFGGYQMRSDETAFIAAKWEKGYLFNSTSEPLKYCTDLIALDMGHQKFTNITFLYNMPHLRFLILADGPVYDITPIASLQELEYLELFKTQVTDLSPLLECKNLKDLNICYIPFAAADSAYEVLLQTTWLERLFYFGNPWSQAQRDAIRDAYPKTSEVVLYNGLESTGLDWRYHERYYEMRDLLEIYYMPGGTNGEDK